MGVPTGKVDLVNMALAYLAEPQISNIDKPETDTEKLAALLYDNTRQNVIRTYSPHCCKDDVSISRNGDGDSEFADSYTLPNDMLRFGSLTGNRIEFPETLYDIRGRNLLTNAGGANSVKIWYLKDVKEPSQWDAGLRNLVALHLAVAMAYPITKKSSVVQQLNTLLTLEIASYISINGQEVPIRKIQRSKAVEKRKSLSSANVAGKWTVFE